MKAIYLLLLTFGLFVFSFAQELEKADKILSVAREAIYKGVKQTEVKGFKLIKDSLVSVNKLPSVKLEKTIEISFPEQIKIIRKNLLPSIDGENTNNYTKFVITANGKKVSFNSFISFADDEETKVNERDALKQIGLSKKEIEKKLRDKREKLETQKRAQDEAWMEVFPLFLKIPWEAERKFIFIGTAKVDGKKQHVLDLVRTEDEKAENLKAGVKDFIRLFFDEKTLLLTHLKGELETKESKADLKYFFIFSCLKR